jgi:hypothetical protein
MSLTEPADGGSGGLLANMPKTVLQAIYHTVTGKTENLSTVLEGNVEITSGDIDRLHDMLFDQLGLHEKVIEPTITVVVKQKDGKSITYSSWERYKVLKVNNHDVTSEVIMKFEFVIQLPDTPQPQRCIVSVNLDSSLPVIQEHSEHAEQMGSIGFLFFIQRQWRTVVISIDFVDFLIAKSFSSVVEEWFSKLKKCPEKRLNDFLLKRFNLIRAILGQFGRIGFAFFLAAYVWFQRDFGLSLELTTLAVALGLALYSSFMIFESFITKNVLRRLSRNIVPSVILLTEGDISGYDEIKNSQNSSTRTLFSAIFAILLALSVNLLSSYLYSYLTNSDNEVQKSQKS